MFQGSRIKRFPQFWFDNMESTECGRMKKKYK